MTDNKTSNALKWGIIGPGQIAHQFVEDMRYVKGKPMKLVAAMSKDISEARQFTRQYGVSHYFDDLNKMLKQCRPDIVYIATPHSFHFKLAKKCLLEGISVLCEKPFALNEKQGTILIQTARDKNVFFMEGMWIRFLPVIRQLRTLLDQNILGTLNALEADMSYRAPKDQDNRFYNPDLGGGSLLDLGIYPAYLALLTLGIPTKIQATARVNQNHIDKNCAFIFTYSSGAYAMLQSSIINESRKEAIIYGENGKITIKKPWNEKPQSMILSLYDKEEITFPCEWPGRGFQFEIEEVIRCLDQGLIETPLHSHANSLQLLSLMDKIRGKTKISYPSEGSSAF